MVMVTPGLVVMAPALVEVGGGLITSVEVGVKPVAIQGVADHGGVAVGLEDFLALTGCGVVMITRVEVDVAAGVVERREGLGPQDGVGRGRPVVADAVEGDATCFEAARASAEGVGRFTPDGRRRDEVGLGDFLHVGGQAFYAVVMVLGVYVGAGGTGTVFLRIGSVDVAVGIVHEPGVVLVETRHVFDKGTVHVVGFTAFQPDAAGFGAVGDVVRAPGAHLVVGRGGAGDDLVAGGLRSVGEGAGYGGDGFGEVARKEVGGVDGYGYFAIDGGGFGSVVAAV